jgi:hypothetical protein
MNKKLAATLQFAMVVTITLAPLALVLFVAYFLLPVTVIIQSLVVTILVTLIYHLGWIGGLGHALQTAVRHPDDFAKQLIRPHIIEIGRELATPDLKPARRAVLRELLAQIGLRGTNSDRALAIKLQPDVYKKSQPEQKA